jgi:hypothetical protein
MVPPAAVGNVAASIRALCAKIRLVWHRLTAVRKLRQRGEYERLLASSADRFELERRERAWTRWQSGDGSLLGQ